MIMTNWPRYKTIDNKLIMINDKYGKDCPWQRYTKIWINCFKSHKCK